ncbi:hypothetical protein TWF696_004794 [Orbilia brochopaga]|uniref:Uncharacterized protein n=1 Tax=Orbilia brochopaga TaxID=3140254 RepID=A0AAV9UYV3_9PEZI
MSFLLDYKHGRWVPSASLIDDGQSSRLVSEPLVNSGFVQHPLEPRLKFFVEFLYSVSRGIGIWKVKIMEEPIDGSFPIRVRMVYSRRISVSNAKEF